MMIHIATVHHLSDKWIDIQLKYINKYIKSPHRVYAFLNGIITSHSSKFYYSSKRNIYSHAQKLNILAQKIVENADDGDLIMFIDGDAFPVQEIDSYLFEKLENHKLIAIKRSDDFGDCQPHPAFCVSTVGFWKTINGDWEKGYTWINKMTNQEFTDVGGNLLKILIDNNILWYPLLRSNTYNAHPQWYGVYDNIVYHHGAGFRMPISEVEAAKIRHTFNIFQKLQSKIIFLRRFLYLNAIKDSIQFRNSLSNSILTDYNFYKKL